jgi:hypothetical protein
MTKGPCCYEVNGGFNLAEKGLVLHTRNSLEGGTCQLVGLRKSSLHSLTLG